MNRKPLARIAALAGAGSLLASAAFAQLGGVTTPPVIDGEPDDWGALMATTDSGGIYAAGAVGAQFQWSDAEGDDLGDGDYVYPLDGNFNGTEFDISEFRMAYDLSRVYVMVRTHGDANLFDRFGARVVVYIDREDVTTGASTTDVGNHRAWCQAPEMDFADMNWDYHVSNRGGWQSAYIYKVDGDQSDFPGGVIEFENKDNGTLEMSIPWPDLGGYPTGPVTLKLVVGAGGEDSSNWREVVTTAQQWQGGGGCDDAGGGCDFDNDCDLYDLVGSSGVSQNADLTPGGGCASRPVITNSVITLPLDPPQALGADNGQLVWANNFVRLQFSKAATGATVTDPGNYSVINDNPDNVTVTAAATGPGNWVYLTLSRDLAQADIDGNVQVALSTNIVSDDGAGVAPGTAVDVPAVLSIIPVTMDASGDAQQFLADPYVQGAWDDWNYRWQLSDGTDPYDWMPGDQTEAGDTPGDGIYMGRVFTTASTENRAFALKSDYDFGSLLAPGKGSERPLGAGYWNQPYDRLNNGEPISISKPYLSRLLATPVTATLNLVFFDYEFTVDQILNGDVKAYVQAGGTWGKESALPTDPPTDMPGEADITDGKQMNYVETTAGYHVFQTQVTFPAGIPDVGSFRFGYTLGTDPNLTYYREEQSETAGQEGNAGQDPATTADTTIHYHLARVASNDGSKAVGRTLLFVFRTVSVDIPAPPDDGVTSSVESWMLY